MIAANNSLGGQRRRSIVSSTAKPTSKTKADVGRNRLPTDGQIISITPSFQWDRLNWDAEGDRTVALKLLFKVFHLGPESIIADGVLSLGRRVQVSDSRV